MVVARLLLSALSGAATLVLVVVASAKGGPYIDGATISGSGLSRPVVTSFSLTDGYDDMSESPVPDHANTMATWYDITLHYDFEEDGYGRRTWNGKFDGTSYLYFAEPMSVGPGVWARGWYRGSPLLAAELQRALAPSPPATGSGSSSAPQSQRGTATVALALALAGLVSVRFLVGRPKR